MLNTSNARSASKKQNVESAVEQLKSILDNPADWLILVGTADAEISGVIDDGEDIYREVLPLGDGIHIVITLNLPTSLPPGIHEQ